MTKKSKMDRNALDRQKEHFPTEETKHRFGGPGKSAREGHLDPDDQGNKPGQNQAGPGHEHHAGDNRLKRDVTRSQGR
ncbi:hypothetical protein [Rhodospirillaceae bacterium SYSU D60014]|uniref:hypothetical protein n=1 Tax=Virgifigura deserti TaxID=2268457 RepID=UPI0013C4DC6D